MYCADHVLVFDDFRANKLAGVFLKREADEVAQFPDVEAIALHRLTSVLADESDVREPLSASPERGWFG